MPVARRLATAVASTLVLAFAAPAVASASAVLDFEPSPVTFPDVGIHDQGQNQNVKVVNHGDEGAGIGALNATSPFYVDYNGTDCDDIGGFLAQGASCNLAVRFDPEDPGPASGEATIEYSDAGGTSVATVELSGTGARGTLQAGSVNFNSQPYFYGGQQQQLNIANNSPFTVIGGGATISGPDQGSFSIPGSGCNGNFLGPGQNCGLSVQFEPGAPGTYEAQLEFSNDGTVDPLVVPLVVEVLNGPMPSIEPGEVDFGTVEVGSSAAPRSLVVTNVGDFPLQIQQMLIISGSPQVFPVGSDGCGGQVVMPAEECEMEIGFQPTTAGERYASVFLISNTPQPVSIVSLVGEGMFKPDGSAELTNQAKVGVPLVCLTSGYRDADTLSYRWLSGEDPIAGASQSVYVPVGADAGASLICEVTAVNTVGSQTVTSAPSAPVAAADPGPAGEAGPPGNTGPTGATGAKGERPSLFTSFAGSSARGYALNVSSRSGLNRVRTTLSHLRIRARRATGFVRTHGPAGTRRFPLRGRTSASGSGIVVTLTRSAIEIEGLPSRTTSVTVGLGRDLVFGRGGRVSTTALVGDRSLRASTVGLFTRVP